MQIIFWQKKSKSCHSLSMNWWLNVNFSVSQKNVLHYFVKNSPSFIAKRRAIFFIFPTHFFIFMGPRKVTSESRYSSSPESTSIKVIIEKSRGGRFLWNWNWDLGWIWAGSHSKKKHLVRLWATFEAGFSSFHGPKKKITEIKNIEASTLKSCIKRNWYFVTKIVLTYCEKKLF